VGGGVGVDADQQVVGVCDDGHVLDDLESGAADLALGGLWVPGMYAGSPRELTVIYQLNHQAPKAIVQRGKPESFEFAGLRARSSSLPASAAARPNAVTAGLIREAGVDPAEITFLRDLSTPMSVELFYAGLGDAIILVGPAGAASTPVRGWSGLGWHGRLQVESGLRTVRAARGSFGDTPD
jgi:NitT/TauT family transport system substrate-binding protein